MDAGEVLDACSSTSSSEIPRSNVASKRLLKVLVCGVSMLQPFAKKWKSSGICYMFIYAT